MSGLFPVGTQGSGKGGAASRGVGNRDGSMMRLHDFPGNGQSQPEVAGILARGIAPVKTVKQMGFYGVRNSRPIIRHGKKSGLVLLTQG